MKRLVRAFGVVIISLHHPDARRGGFRFLVIIKLMKILQINAFHYLRGGVERYYFGLSQLLKNHGHEIVHFAMQHPKNFPSPFARYFVSQVNFEAPALSQIGQIPRAIWSFEAQRNLQKLITDTKPDLAHLHAPSRYLTPSIIPVLKKNKIPMVMHLHDFKPILPQRILLYNDQLPCHFPLERFSQVVLGRKIKGSFWVSLLGEVETVIHEMQGVYQLIDHFISPSQFVKDIYQKFNRFTGKISVIPHFIDYQSIKPQPSFDENNPYLIFFGRLSCEKGVNVVIESMQQTPHVKLLIAGLGPDEKLFRNLVAKLGLKNVLFVGEKTGESLFNLIRGSLFSINPSLAQESFGYSILESLALGKPVIASNSGAFPELVQSEKTGLLFEANNVIDLSSKITRLLANRDLIAKMGKEARERIEENYNPEQHYQRLLKIYQQL